MTVNTNQVKETNESMAIVSGVSLANVEKILSGLGLNSISASELSNVSLADIRIVAGSVAM